MSCRYIADELAAGERKRYKAAGVLLYQFMGPKDELHVLMGRLDALPEYHQGSYRQKGAACYSFLGEALELHLPRASTMCLHALIACLSQWMGHACLLRHWQQLHQQVHGWLLQQQ